MTRTSLGNRLRELREQAGLSRDDLAAAAGITERRLQDAELGVHEISAVALAAIADALDVSLDEFRRPARITKPRPGRPRKLPSP